MMLVDDFCGSLFFELAREVLDDGVFNGHDVTLDRLEHGDFFGADGAERRAKR